MPLEFFCPCPLTFPLKEAVGKVDEPLKTPVKCGTLKEPNPIGTNSFEIPTKFVKSEM